MPSWQAVMSPSSRNRSAVSLSWAIFLQTSGSSMGTSSSRGQAAVPIKRSGSAWPLIAADEAQAPWDEAVDAAGEALVAFDDDRVLEWFNFSDRLRAPRLKFFLWLLSDDSPDADFRSENVRLAKRCVNEP